MIRQLAGRSYFVSKRYALAQMNRAQTKRSAPPIVVFSMGKTGSTAVARSVQDATGDRVFQVFRLEAERLAQAEQRYRVNNREAKRAGRENGPLPFRGALHLWESEYLLRHPPSPSAPWTVITTVREPIAQAVSAFFHGSGRRGVLDDGAVRDASTPDPSTIDALTEQLVEEGWIRAPLRWFDREFAPALGVNVFEHAFDTERGHAVIETPSARVLLLRQENLASAPAALGKFLGLPGDVPVAGRNEAATKDYASAYRDFLGGARFAARVVDEAYDSRYARHFYADSDRERLHERWVREPER